MPVWRLFSRRQQNATSLQGPAYSYNTLPDTLRVQIVHILKDAIGSCSSRYVVGRKGYSSEANAVWEEIYRIITRETGRFKLSPHEDRHDLECFWYLQHADPLQALDLVEIAFVAIDVIVRQSQHYQLSDNRIRITPDEAIEELNTRFQENGIGYRFEAGRLVRLDSEYLHEEVFKPAISLMRIEKFDGPVQEFMVAHDHYRHERYREAISAAANALESTLKAICLLKGWPFSPSDGANRLVQVVVDQGLFPNDLSSHLGAILSALRSGLPTIRNKVGAHGQGLTLSPVPRHLAAHALHLAGANIVFLMESYRSTT